MTSHSKYSALHNFLRNKIIAYYSWKRAKTLKMLLAFSLYTYNKGFLSNASKAELAPISEIIEELKRKISDRTEL